ncbi:MAG TPA: hypothetical protein VNB22_04665 [Pyrinomonadaceae bacterium]|nr:hypothetical protein [Pyrinomonadaceae bacterium]
MPFEDFYEKSDKEKTSHRKSVVSTFALLAVVFISIYGLYLTYENHLEESAKESARIKHADALCISLPKPYLFNFIKRDEPVSYNNTETDIVYHYRTEGDSKITIPQFLQWFKTNGWERGFGDQLIFTKGSQTITFKSTDDYVTHFDIHCSVEESKIEFGV